MKRLVINIKIKDPFSALSHGIGIILGVIFFALLVPESLKQGKLINAGAFTLFCMGTILVYLASTLYHWLPLTVSKEKLFREIDQSAIFLMIAGTYSPICLVVLPRAWGIPLIIGIWLLAFAGITLIWIKRQNQRKRTGYRRWAGNLIYLVMGWMAVIAIYPMTQNFATDGIVWLVAGGIAYSIGAFCYGIKRPNPIPDVIEFHEIFHLFVLIGTLCHFWMMYVYILPLGQGNL